MVWLNSNVLLICSPASSLLSLQEMKAKEAAKLAAAAAAEEGSTPSQPANEEDLEKQPLVSAGGR